MEKNILTKNDATVKNVAFNDSLKPKSRSSKKIFVIAFLVLATLLVFIIGSDLLNPFMTTNSIGVKVNDKEKASPTPVPFAELTIPYLRERTYSSKLNALTENSVNSSYTSHLTSYDSDGLNINAEFTLPNGEKPENGWPAIIFIHGYIPPINYTTLGNYSAYVDSLASSGFAVLKIDLRGHGSSEGDASGAYYSSDYIIDALNAHSALRNRDEINPDGIGIWGHSMAGNVALRTLAVHPSLKAAVIWAGAVYTYQDMRDYGIQDGSYRPPVNASETQKRRELLFKTHGRFKSDSPFWKSVAATNYLKDINGAIQLNHAADDDVVSVEYSRGLAKLLQTNGVDFELKEYQSGGHNINGVSYNDAMANTIAFFKKHLN